MQVILEMKTRDIMSIDDKAQVYCRCFEDNMGALELANVPKLPPRTKHINLVYHHFQEHVQKGTVKVFPIPSDEQLADMMTKPLAQNQLTKLRKLVLGW